MSIFSQAELDRALQQCESEPIHQIGQIQPHGALLVLSPDPLRIVLQASNNLVDFFDLHVDGVCGKPLAELIGAAKSGQIEELIQAAGDNNAATGIVSLTQRQTRLELQARVFVSGEVYVLELMRDMGKYQDKHLNDLLLPLHRSIMTLIFETDSYQYFDKVARVVRELTEFDRVMVYRFDALWDGEVIAENRIDSAHSYLGSHFPASDIPPQARRLYSSNLVRQIADTEACPVSVLPVLNPVTGQPLDMTHSVLRSFSPVHIEYLRNMGVRASMSISLLQNGRLWGLIACHHMTPKRISNTLQEAAAFISQTVSAKLTLLEVHEQNKLGMEASLIVGELLRNITADTEEAILPYLLSDLLLLLNATGVIMVVEGRYYGQGEVPDPEAISDLFVWLSNRSETEELFSCDHLAQHFAQSGAYAEIASGLLATPLSVEMNNCILWLRKEKPRTVHWAGSPEKVFLKHPAGVHLSPRKSFETWTETWRGRSVSWSHVEIEMAKSIALALTQGLAQKHQLDKAQAESRRAYETLRQADQFMAIFENSPIAVRIVNVATSQVVFANQRYAELINSTPDKVIGINPRQYYANPLEYDEVAEQIGKGERVANKLVELLIHGEPSITKWTLASYMRLEFQNETAILGWYYDITERNMNEQKQQQLAEQIKLYADEITDLYEHAPCGYHSLDKEGCFQHINQTELKLLGYTRDEIIGKRRFADLLAPDSIPIFQRTFSQLEEKGEVRDLEMELTCKDGTILPALISSTAVYDADGNFIACRSTLYDVTERKKIAQERIGYLKRLEDASRRLVTAQEDARRRLSSELHDRTSPNLAAISINLDIITAELPQDHSSDIAERLEDTRALITDTAASIREICTDMRPPLLDYAGLAAALESYVQQFTRRTGVAFRFQCGNRDARYTAELESLLFRIFQEALTNCAKHAHAKSVLVTLSGGGHPIELTITDDGVGFDPERLGESGAIGLGILNMRDMAEVIGAKLIIESEHGKGTRIAVEIPYPALRRWRGGE